ncbi:MAG: hypothetical protein AAGH76_17815 [Pseudomonadota bacterium]
MITRTKQTKLFVTTPYALLMGLMLTLPVCAVACERLSLDFLAPLVGEWNQYRIDGDKRTFIGTFRTEFAAGGCALVQYFDSPDGDFSYVSLSAFEDNGDFVERYALSTGRIAAYRWERTDTSLYQVRIVNNPDSKRHFVYLDITKESYFIADERSDDGGETWKRLRLVHIVRHSNDDNKVMPSQGGVDQAPSEQNQ